MTALKKQRLIMLALVIATILIYSIIALVITTSKRKTYHGTFMQNTNIGAYHNGYIC